MYLRNAIEADLPAIVEIYNSTIAGRMVTADLEPVSVESRRAWFRDHSDSFPFWVLEEGDHIAGWLSFQPFHSRLAYRATAEVSIYVAKAFRRKGLGQRLLLAAMEQAPLIGLRTLVGLIFAHNEPSLQLFEVHGFTRWAHLPRVAELDGIERDLVIVGRRMDEGPSSPAGPVATGNE